jgi:hypothetical protein
MMVFRLDGSSVVPLPHGSAGPGTLTILGCDESNPHTVAALVREFVKSPAHLNGDVKAATSGGQHAIASVR